MREKLKAWTNAQLEIIGFLFFVSLTVSVLAAWITHAFYTIKMGYYAFLALGLTVPFIGIIHGYLIWLGVV
jgi:hypothetical protein